MARAAVDIGSNSVRMLVVDERGLELGRWERVTGLGRGVDEHRRLDPAAVERTVAVLAEYRRLLVEHGAEEVRAVATSATRDATDREDFLSRAEAVLGVLPATIGGEEEAAFAYAGATSDPPDEGPFLVVDIGGGSTELVWEREAGIASVSVDIGSVRLTERALPNRPASREEVAEASRHVAELLSSVDPPPRVGTVIGVAGTWTSLAAIQAARHPAPLHHATLTLGEVEALMDRLASLTVEQTAGLSGLHPDRAPVILAGAVVALESMRMLTAHRVVVSERDLLDGVVASLAGG